MNANATKTIADTIFLQLGGNRFVAMTGAKCWVAHKDGLSFKIGRFPGVKTTHVQIRLNAMDLYDIDYTRVTKRGLVVTIVHQTRGVYADMMQADFTAVTGLDTHL